MQKSLVESITECRYNACYTVFPKNLLWAVETSKNATVCWLDRSEYIVLSLRDVHGDKAFVLFRGLVRSLQREEKQWNPHDFYPKEGEYRMSE